MMILNSILRSPLLIQKYFSVLRVNPFSTETVFIRPSCYFVIYANTNYHSLEQICHTAPLEFAQNGDTEVLYVTFIAP